MRRLAVALVVMLLGFASVDAPATGVAPVVPCHPGAEWDLLTMVNYFRASNSMPALTMSAELNAKAQAWSENMAAQRRLYHSTLTNGVSSGWSALAENVAYNSAGLSAAQVALQNSAGHRANLLGNYTEVGLGVTVDSSGIYWVSQVFARRTVATPTYTGPAGASSYAPVGPAVVFDTTSGAPAAAGSQRPVQIAGLAGVPATATAAVVTLEAITPSGSGFVQALGPGSTVGQAANVNTGDGEAANTAVARLDASGRFQLYTSVTTHLRVTLTGYFAPVTGPVSAGRYKPLTPARLLDTRDGTGYAGARPIAGQTVAVQVTGRGGVPATGAGSVAVNVAAVQSDGDGWVQAGAAPMVADAWRNLHVNRAGQTIANLLILPLDGLGRVSLRTTVGTHLTMDVVGWFTNSSQPASTEGLFVPMTPSRGLDTRNAVGIATRTPVRAANVVVPGVGDLPKCPRAVVGSLAMIPTASSTFGQAGPLNGYAPGSYSSINAQTLNRAVANTFISSTGALWSIGVNTPSDSHMIADFSGWFS